MSDLLANERFLTFLEAIGTPVLILLVFMFGLWRMARWIGNELVRPVVQHQTSFLESIANLATRNAETLAGLKSAVEKLERAIETLVMRKERDE